MCGSAEVGVEAARLGAEVTLADISPRMLAHAAARAYGAGRKVRLQLIDIARPSSLPAGPFDAVCLSFGLRYLDDPPGTLATLARLLKPGGRLVILEFVVPDYRRLSAAQLALSLPAAAYFFHLLPRIGSFLTGQPQLYRYLIDSTRQVGYAGHLYEWTEEAGLHVAAARHMGFGLVQGLIVV